MEKHKLLAEIESGATHPKFCSSWISLKDDMRSCLEQVGINSSSIDDPEQIFHLLRKKAKSGAGCFWTHYALGRICLAGGRWELAASYLEKAVGVRQDFAEAYVYLLLAYDKLGRTEGAVNIIQRALDVQPDGAGVYNLIADALKTGDMPELAINFCRVAYQKGPGSSHLCTKIGSVASLYGAKVLALKFFNRALDLDASCIDAKVQVSILLPEYILYVKKLADLISDDDMEASARAMYLEILQYDNDWAEALMAFGVFLQKKKLYREAEEYFLRASRSDESLSAVYNCLGNLKRDMKDEEMAEFYYRKCIELSPNMSTASDNLGAILLKKGEVSAAIQYIKTAVKLDPTCKSPYCHLGIALRHRGEFKVSESLFKYAISLDADYVHAYLELAETYLAMNNNYGASVMFKRALSRDSGIKAAMLGLGRAAERQGNIAEAKRWYEITIRFGGEDAASSDAAQEALKKICL